MLKVQMGARNSNQTAILVEGDNAFCGGKITKEDIERSAKLPEGYVIDTITKDENFWYKVIEI